jgi:hypothetical protein
MANNPMRVALTFLIAPLAVLSLLARYDPLEAQPPTPTTPTAQPGETTPQTDVPETADSILAALQDPPYDRYIDVRLLARALQEEDSERMTDLALQLVEGERVLQRPHKHLAAKALFNAALRVAILNSEKKQLSRLTQCAEASGNKDLLGLLQLTRDLQPGNGVETDSLRLPVSKTTAVTFAQCGTVLHQLRTIARFGDKVALRQVALVVGTLEIDKPAHDALYKLLDDTNKQLPEKLDTDSRLVLKQAR